MNLSENKIGSDGSAKLYEFISSPACASLSTLLIGQMNLKDTGTRVYMCCVCAWLGGCVCVADCGRVSLSLPTSPLDHSLAPTRDPRLWC